MVNNNIYSDKSTLQDEKSLFTENYWILAAHKNELKNNNDFVAFNYLDKSIFIQNYNGELRCFDNICLHRFNSIHKEPFGNRASTCLYHYWTYGKNGNITGFKCRNSFKEINVKEKALHSYKLDFCGDFIFINFSNTNLSLKSFLGDIYEELKDISFNFGDRITDYNKPHKANWKLLVENVLECYHCSSIHENSFAKLGYGSITPISFKNFNAHSWCEFPRSEERRESKTLEKVFKNRTYKVQGYKHFYIYPSTFISTVEGKGFYIGLMNIIDENLTNLRVRYFSSKFGVISDSEKNMIEYVNETSKSALDLVLNEDKEVLENIQKNISKMVKVEPIFGDEEFRIIDFYKFYHEEFQKLK